MHNYMNPYGGLNTILFDRNRMASEAPSWADQWGNGGIGVLAAKEETTDGKKDASGKKSSKAKAGFNRAKMVAFIGVNWMKNLVHRKKKDATSS